MRNKVVTRLVFKKVVLSVLFGELFLFISLSLSTKASALSLSTLSTFPPATGQRVFALSNTINYKKYSQNGILFYRDCNPGANWEKSVTTNPKPTGKQITWIGDSYTQGAESIIQGKLSGVDLDFQVSKTFKGNSTSNPSGLSILNTKKDELREYIVFALGTNDGMNGGVTKEDIEKAVSLVDGKKIIFVTAYTANGNNYDSFNQALKEVEAGHSGQVYVADWAAVAKPEYYEQDSSKIHPTGHYQEWFDVIYDALPGGGASSTVGGVTTTTYNGHTIAFPIAGASKNNISGGRGQYTFLSNIPCSNSGGCHYGPSADAAFDICNDGEKCSKETPVVSITDGTITRDIQTVRNGAQCNHVRIKSDIDGTVIAYMHLLYEPDLPWHAGDKVKAGDLIGHVSDVGACHDYSTPHVHIDKGMDTSATGGPSGPSERDPELVKMINAAYAALPESGTSGSTNVNSSETVSSAPSLSPTADNPKNNAAVVWNTIANAGIDGLSDNPAVIAGIIGNLMQESTPALDPYICQYGGGAGRGIFQASTESRKAGMFEYMSSHGAPWKEGCSMSAANASQDEIFKAVQAETEYMMTETEFKDFASNLSVPTEKTPEGYSDLFLVIFEGANQGSESIKDPGVAAFRGSNNYLWSDVDSRRNYAKDVYEEFSDGSYIYSSSSDIDPCLPSGGADSSANCTGGLPERGMNLEQARAFMKMYADAASKGTTGTVTLEGIQVTDSGCTGASGNGIGGALNNCSAFSAWFVNRYTIVNDFPVTQGSQTVDKLVSNYGFKNLGNKPEVYSIVSMGPMSGSANGWSNHTGVVLGIDEAKDKIIIGEASCSMGYFVDNAEKQWPGANEYSLAKFSSGGTYAPVYASTKGFLENVCSGGGNVDISQLTIEEKVAQLFVIYANQYDSFRSAVGSAPGGVIFMNEGGDIAGDRASMKAKIGNMQSQAKEKMFIAVDEEGGAVARLASAGLCDNTGNASGLTSKNAAKSAGSAIGDCMKGLGFNVDFAPVADTLYATGSSVLKNRVFADSSDSNTVATLANSFREGLESKGVIATYKHFPGHGSAAGDTHSSKVLSSKSWSSFKKEDVIPFKTGIDNGLKMIMTAHITTNDSDNAPASMSSKYLQTYLRGELGYKGLIITDALNMGAATDYSPTPALSAFKAGADLLLMPKDPTSAYNSVLSAIKSGDITEARLDESVQRILNVKAGL